MPEAYRNLTDDPEGRTFSAISTAYYSDDSSSDSLLQPEEYDRMYEVEQDFWWYRGIHHIVLTMLTCFWDWAHCPNPKVLDAGCGTGALLSAMNQHPQMKHARFTGLDLSQAALMYTRKRMPDIAVFHASLAMLPFPDATFDIVTNIDVICHMPDDFVALTEITRVLQPGGYLFLNVPAYNWLLSEHDTAVRIKRRYNRAHLQKCMERAGLNVVFATHVNTLLFVPALLVRLAAKLQAARWRSDPAAARSDLRWATHRTLNTILARLFLLEGSLFGKTPLVFPFGLSVFIVARKPTDATDVPIADYT